MDWTDNEKNMIYKWACSKYTDDISKKILSEIDKEVGSYWIKIENDMTISEYYFENAAGLKKMLEESLGNCCHDIVTPLVVAAIKCRNTNEIEETQDIKKDKVAVPEYIYTI